MKRAKDINKNWLKNHNSHLAMMKVRFREVRRKKNKAKQGVSREELKRRLMMERFRDYQKVMPPKLFSLVKNPIETLAFIATLEQCLKQKKKVFVKLKDVKYIGDGALVVLLSSMINFRVNNVDFNGDFPSNEQANKRLQDSGFFDELYSNRHRSRRDTYDLSKRTIFTHASKIVDAGLSGKLISQISKRVWGNERRCLGVQRAYIELMHNTNNHASVGKQGEHHWWTTVSYDESRQVACFAFIDYGVGIIKSLSTDSRSKIHRILTSFKNLFKYENDAELLELLLKGKIHEVGRNHSSTHEYYRGKGLPGIYDACTENHISQLVVISNKAMADVSKDEYTQLEREFSGTFVYWEVNRDNINLPVCS